MSARRRILFIDEEPRVLAGLRRALYGQRDEWDMVFTDSAQPALASFDQTPFDIIVTDMQMPGANGDLLREVMSRYPNTVRIVLSSESQRETMLRAVGPMHQYLAKPCDPETLQATLARACALKDLLAKLPWELREPPDGLGPSPDALSELVPRARALLLSGVETGGDER